MVATRRCHDALSARPPSRAQVSKKIAGTILSLLAKEANRVSQDYAGHVGRTVDGRPDVPFHVLMRQTFDKYFDLYGEDEEAERGVQG